MVLYVWYLMNCLFFDFGMDRKSCMQAGIYLLKSVRLTRTSIVFGNSRRFFLVSYTKDFGRITRF